MIIEISPKFSTFSAAEWLPYHRAVENLINAHGEGWHFFSPSRDIATAILSNCMLSRTQSDILRYHIVTRLSTISGQVKSADHVIFCNPEGAGNFTTRRNQIPVPLIEFSSIEACSPAKLITENSHTDGRLLELLSDFVSRDLGYSTPIKIEHIHGGGSSVSMIYKEALQSPRPALCVVDSDKKYSSDRFGETAQRVNDVASAAAGRSYETVQHCTHPVREMENALPLSLLLLVYSDNRDVQLRIKSLIDYANSRKLGNPGEQYNVLDFFDIKNGIKRSDIARMPVSDRRHFDAFAKLVNHGERTASYDDLHDHTVIHNGVAHNVVEQFLNFIENSPRCRNEVVQKLKKSPSWEWLENLLRLLLSYGSAGQRLPIR